MILLVGASASGKTEIAKYLFSRYAMVKAITHTTRQKRLGERDNVDYHFVSKEDFLRLKEEGAFVETTEYNGNYYGCSKAECGDDKCIILDPAGIHSFLALQNPRIVTFFLRATPATRLMRMRLRGDDEESIKKRLNGDEATFSFDAMPPVDFVLDCDERSVADLGDEVFRLYQERLNG